MASGLSSTLGNGASRALMAKACHPMLTLLKTETARTVDEDCAQDANTHRGIVARKPPMFPPIGQPGVNAVRGAPLPE